MTTFTDFNLHSNINKAIIACGYTQPTPVQAKSIPLVMNQQDVVVSAQTGTGKTASFVLPALHNLSTKAPEKKTRVLILTPTRELASQITKATSLYGKFMRFNIVSLVGGMPYHHQIRDLQRGADIIVATPGRLMDHIEQKRVNISDIDMLVLDEADRMLDMGFIDDVQFIAKLTPSKRQTLLFSATLDNKLMNAVKHLLKNPVRIDLSKDKIAAPQIRQEMYKVSNQHHKIRLLKQFLSDGNIYKAIIFSATKVNADNLADQLCDDGFAAAPLHGDLRQNVRNRTLEKLRNGKIQFLVATDVAARGIDISDITHVFNYDLPRFSEDYVHRIGRTGRAGKTGIAISFVSPSDARNLQAIERYTGQKIKLIQHNERESIKGGERETLSLKKEFTRDRDRGERSFAKKVDGKREFKPNARRFDKDRNHHHSSENFSDGKRKRFDRRDDKPGFKKRSIEREGNEGFKKRSIEKEGKEGFKKRSIEREGNEGFKKRSIEREGNEGFKKRSIEREGSEGFKKRSIEREGNEGFKKRSFGRDRVENPGFKKRAYHQRDAAAKKRVFNKEDNSFKKRSVDTKSDGKFKKRFEDKEVR